MAFTVQSGQIFWVDSLPPLDGTEPSRRPAIVIDYIDDCEPVIVVGVTTDRSDPSRIDLPCVKDEPGTTTNLPERCCVIPRWIIALQPARISEANYIGYLPQVTLDALSNAVDELLADWPPKIIPKSG